MTNLTAKRRDARERALLGALLFTGLAAIAGGVLLVLRPDGSLLQANPAVLRGTPFPDWRVPGILLGALVGGGGIGTGVWVLTRGSRARELVLLYAIGLLAFETVEFFSIGFQPLEAFFGLVALGLGGLALTSKTIDQQTGVVDSGRTSQLGVTPSEVKSW